MVRSAQQIIKHPDRLFIGGKWVKPSTDAVIDVIAPASEELFLRVAEARDADINHAVQAARDAFDNGPWPRMSPTERGEYLRALAKKSAERVEDFAFVWPNEMGIVHSAARAACAEIPNFYNFYAGLAEKFKFEERHKPARGG